ncbi:MFS transporter [Domibacillus sp. DTU_2020_1001157_1_SI_ALB_TIR_016]|uniref:MFS transporter n=1 Tax=Domibacillus sp. DTU_2020_1001157_1_SI_ALB_TIR_016 TaxID=3077789 RepID=UPI0028E1F10B|nr:MFS transporter [Domibacillus sp. DTU_2020_1001157_1_SI_ALB_TIR_016]WNS78195.1 MFS transporter [Domibacillus sp. DTU_2020_1001157_1_SI_ALB_TIR_016]
MNPLSSSAPRSENHSFITLLLFWCGLVLLSSMYVTLPLTTLFMDSFGITSAQTAWIGSSFSLCYALGCLLYGPFSDKYGRKIFLAGSISLLSVITISIGFVESFHALLVLRGLQGLVAAAFAPISLVYAGELFPPHKRLTAIGFISSGFLMASIVGQVFSGMVSEAFGWQSIFFVLGAVYLITAIAVIFRLPKEQTPKSAESILRKFSNMTGLLRNTQLLLAFSITFVLLLSLVGMYTVLGSYLSSARFGLQSGEILAVRGAGILGMLFSPFAGQIAQKIGLGAVLKGGLAMAAAGLLAIGFSPTLPILVLATIIFVAGIALVTPVVISLVSQLAGNARGSAVSFNAFVLFLGASAGPGLVMGLSKTERYVLALDLLSAVMVIALLVSLFIKAEAKAPIEAAAKQQISQ